MVWDAKMGMGLCGGTGSANLLLRTPKSVSGLLRHWWMRSAGTYDW